MALDLSKQRERRVLDDEKTRRQMKTEETLREVESDRPTIESHLKKDGAVLTRRIIEDAIKRISAQGDRLGGYQGRIG